MSFGLIDLAVSRQNQIYLSFFEPNEQKDIPHKPVTAVYNGQNYQEINKSVIGNPFVLRWSCLITKEKVLPRPSGPDVKELFQKGLPVGCSKGKVLLLSKEKEFAVLTLYDLELKKVLNEIRPPIRIDRFTSDEWFMTEDLRAIIKVDNKKVGAQLIPTGKLSIMDVKDGNNFKQIVLPIDSDLAGRVIGLSEGPLLFYGTTNKVYVIDLIKGELVEEIELPFTPTGIVWPQTTL